MPLPKRPVHGLDDVNHRTRDRETLNRILDHSFDDSRVQTKAEILAGVPVINPAFAPGHIRRYGAKVDNSTDDTTPIQNAINVMAQSGGGIVYGWDGGATKTTTELINKDRVIMELQGGLIAANLSAAADTAVRLRNYSVIQNGYVTVASSGSPGSQSGCHSCICVGALLGSGGTVASPSVDVEPTGWAIRNMQGLFTDKAGGGVAIQIMSGANNGLIEGIQVPSNNVMFGAIHADWGSVGNVDSSDVPGTRTRFDANQCYTTHPNNIRIRSVDIGALSKTKTGAADVGSHGVRLSGVYNFSIRGVRAEQTTYAFIQHTAGDLGFEFADAAIKPLAHQNISFEEMICKNCVDGYLALVDCFADNIDAAVTGSAYAPLLDPLTYTNLELHRCAGVGGNTGSGVDGIRFNMIRGGIISGCDVQKFNYGFNIEERCYGTSIVGGRTFNNRDDGIWIGHGTRPPADISIDGLESYLNGYSISVGVGAGIHVGRVDRINIRNCKLGHLTPASELYQVYGIRCDTNSATNIDIEDNHARSGKNAASLPYSLLTSTDYGVVKTFRGNTHNSSGGFSAAFGGLNIIPDEQFIDADGTVRRVHRADTSALTAGVTPTAGTWVRGDRIYYTNPASAGFIGTVCTTGGSPGTWKTFGLIS